MLTEITKLYLCQEPIKEVFLKVSEAVHFSLTYYISKMVVNATAGEVDHFYLILAFLLFKLKCLFVHI